MSEGKNKIGNDDLSLAVVGLLTAAITTIFMTGGSFSLLVVPLGVILFLIGFSFSSRLQFDRSGSIAFYLVQGGALLCVIGWIVEKAAGFVLDPKHKVFGEITTIELVDVCIWVALSAACRLFIKTGKRG